MSRMLFINLRGVGGKGLIQERDNVNIDVLRG